jgi:hypothetical protein
MAHLLSFFDLALSQPLHRSSNYTNLISVSSRSSLDSNQHTFLTQQQHNQDRQPRTRWVNTRDTTDEEGHACRRCDSLNPTLRHKNNVKAFRQLRGQYKAYAVRLIGGRGWCLGDAVRAARVRYEGVKQRLREERDQHRLEHQLERERALRRRQRQQRRQARAERERRSSGVPPRDCIQYP